MNKELQQAIMDHLFKNESDFGLVNNTVKAFKAYIYDDKGEYLIGGSDVSKFITEAVKLLRGQYK